MDHVNVITGRIIGAAVRIHSKLGPGMLESVYETILARDPLNAGLHVERQKAISFDFEGLWFDNACRTDLFVEHRVVVEVKSAASAATRTASDLFGSVVLGAPV